jgi:hypothetical protein
MAIGFSSAITVELHGDALWPKSDPVLNFAVAIEISKGGAPAGRTVSIRRANVDPGL